jgi:hypothetical protein
MEVWRRQFREYIADHLREIPQAPGVPDLREASTFAEAVAEEMGPRLREQGYDESEHPAELYAAHRTAYLTGLAYEHAALWHTDQARPLTAAGRERVQQILREIREEPEFLAAMRRHARILTQGASVREALELLDRE